MTIPAALLAFVVGGGWGLAGVAPIPPAAQAVAIFGQGAYVPGPGVEAPVVLGTIKPQYPQAALDAKVQGDVEVEVVVGIDGRVTDSRVVRSADKTFGLDDAAIAAARQWTFKPGTVNGQPAPIIERILETFAMAPGAGNTADAQLVPASDEFATGARHVGPGLVTPIMLTHASPTYTREAMRRKLTGTVELEAIVEKDGTVGPVRVTKSLDSVFGLDAAAIAAAKKWTFRPGTVDGQPVRVIVKLMIEFKLHY